VQQNKCLQLSYVIAGQYSLRSVPVQVVEDAGAPRRLAQLDHGLHFGWQFAAYAAESATHPGRRNMYQALLIRRRSHFRSRFFAQVAQASDD
jgi:hypothetical protein